MRNKTKITFNSPPENRSNMITDEGQAGLPIKGSTNRWKKAQKAEAAAWKKSCTRELTEEIHRRNIKHMRKYTGLTEDELRQMRILEIGGTVVERAFNNTDITPKLSLDPLFPFQQLVPKNGKCYQRVRGVGEFLPLPDKSIDLCWCANVIDHTLNPGIVLEEIRRVLVESGVLVISCDVFPAWTKPLFPVFDVVDSPHPHHFTRAGFRSLVRREFEIKEEVLDRVLHLSLRRNAQLPLARDLKNKMAGIVRVRYVYLLCTPVKRRT